MPGERRPGMDHGHYVWQPIPSRRDLRWPGGSPLALGVIVILEHHEWQPPAGAERAATLTIPNLSIAQHSLREYGHRVGFFRLIELLERHGLKPTIAMDKLTAENYPFLVDFVTRKGFEVMAHGIARTQLISSKMNESDECAYIQSSIEAITRAMGKPPLGWLGPDYGESERTPGLLAEAGIRYVCDWPNDEQPYRMTTASGDLFALPPLYDLDDHVAIIERSMPAEVYASEIRYAAEQLIRDGAVQGRVMLLVLRPWISGQPYRSSYLDEALTSVMENAGIWPATCGEIVEAARGQLDKSS